MDETTRLVIATAMRSMFSKGWVDICAIDKCLQLAKIIPIAPEYRQLHALHCIHFEAMPRELAERIPEMLTQVFDGLPIESMMGAAAPALEANGNSTIKKLLGRIGG
ncbi:MAG: hypothetical protein IPM64_17650 [Phycisphaerales bacterium]|nr:hypothetical protein [Phycisphaerales bacterium]